MKIGMLGLAGAGKKTLFRLLTGWEIQSVSTKEIPGICKVVDPRIDRLSGMYKPKKTAYASFNMHLLPDVEKTQGKAVWLDDIRDMDGLCCVVRAFENPSVFHPEGSVDPVRDIGTFFSELMFSDLLFAEKRKEKLTAELKKKASPDKEKELSAMSKIAAGLNDGHAVNKLGISPEERRILSSSRFLTDKAIVAVINISQGEELSALKEKITADYGKSLSPVFLDAKLEDEINQIADAGERKDFLAGLGIDEPALAKLTRTVYDALGLISYFTVGEDEVRAWTIKKSSTAPEAAGAIHSDIEKGFIRAELIKYADLIEAGNEAGVRAAGKFSLKGKDYIVEDGDILSFRSGV